MYLLLSFLKWQTAPGLPIGLLLLVVYLFVRNSWAAAREKRGSLHGQD